MAKYIPSDSVVMEINRQIELLKPYLGACAGQVLAEANAKLSVLEGLKNFLETLEVKEIGVDLGDPKGDKSAKYIIDTKNLEVKEVGLPNFEQEVKDFCYGFDDRKEAWYNMTPHDQNLMVSPTFANFAMQLAKHFFELGLNASNPIAEENLESFVRQVNDLFLEAGKHYDSVIKEERKKYGGSDLAINLLNGTIDAKELGIQYVLNKLKAQKGENV